MLNFKGKVSNQTPEQFKKDYVDRQIDEAIRSTEGTREHCPGKPEHGEYTSYGDFMAKKVANEAEKQWNFAVQLWNKTESSKDGDEKYIEVLYSCGEDLAEEIETMFKKCGVVC